MTQDTTLRKIGNSTGLTLSKAMRERHGLRVGSRVLITETPDGLLLTPHDPDFARAMEAYEGIAERYKNALRELAR